MQYDAATMLLVLVMSRNIAIELSVKIGKFRSQVTIGVKMGIHSRVVKAVT